MFEVQQELARLAVAEARLRGAVFAEARLERVHVEASTWSARQAPRWEANESFGLSIRALRGGAWGFASVAAPNPHDVRVAARQAVELARGAAVLGGRPAQLVERVPERGSYRARIERDPVGVAPAQREALLERASAGAGDGFEGRIRTRRVHGIYACTEGSEIEQERWQTELDLRVVAHGRSARHNAWRGEGWEWVERHDLPAQTLRLLERCRQVEEAEPCPLSQVPVVLDGAAAASMLAHGLAPALDLERASGFVSGPTWLSPADLGRRRIAGSALSIWNDPTEPGGAGSYGFDHEGTPARRTELVRQGVLVGLLSGRESAARVGLAQSAGSMRSPAWWVAPSPRPANLVLGGGQGSVEDLMADIPRGILIEGPVQVSLDRAGRSLLGQADFGWWIENGVKTEPIASPLLRGSAMDFLSGIEAIGSLEAAPLGLALPTPSGPDLVVGVHSAPVRIRSFEVGSAAPSLPPPSLEAGLPTIPLGPPSSRVLPSNRREDG